LIDFGIAKTRREVDQGQTVYGSMLGTPAYCPPEQIRGEHEKINASSDIYALGNIVFELFSGHQPFGGTQFEVSTKQVNDPIPEDDCREIVEPYRSFILKSTKKDQQDRFQNIQELRDHFEKKFENNVSKNEEKASGKDPITRSEIAHWLKLTAMFLGALLFFLMVFFEVYLILKEL
jgi:serine/threonine protein kinase